jgi:hypothetical protein
MSVIDEVVALSRLQFAVTALYQERRKRQR